MKFEGRSSAWKSMDASDLANGTVVKLGDQSVHLVVEDHEFDKYFVCLSSGSDSEVGVFNQLLDCQIIQCKLVEL